MQEIAVIADLVSRYGMIPILIVIILQLFGLLDIRMVQKDKYPELEGYFKNISTLEKQNKTLLENHFQHEIPDMVTSLQRIEASLKDLNNIMIRIDERDKRRKN